MEADSPSPRWAWTIVGPDDVDGCDPEELWCFEWPHDLDVCEVWETPLPPHTAQQFILELALRRDELDPSDLSSIHEGILVHPGWTADAVSDALKNWATVYAGRGDLHFFWDDIVDSWGSVAAAELTDSPLLRHLLQAIDEDPEPKAILRRILGQI